VCLAIANRALSRVRLRVLKESFRYWIRRWIEREFVRILSSKLDTSCDIAIKSEICFRDRLQDDLKFCERVFKQRPLVDIPIWWFPSIYPTLNRHAGNRWKRNNRSVWTARCLFPVEKRLSFFPQCYDSRVHRYRGCLLAVGAKGLKPITRQMWKTLWPNRIETPYAIIGINALLLSRRSATVVIIAIIVRITHIVIWGREVSRKNSRYSRISQRHSHGWIKLKSTLRPDINIKQSSWLHSVILNSDFPRAWDTVRLQLQKF